MTDVLARDYAKKIMGSTYLVTVYDVTNTAHLLTHGTGERSAHGRVTRRPDARIHAAGVRGFGVRQDRHKTRARRQGAMPELRCRPENSRTRVQRSRTAQQAHEELNTGGGVDFPGRGKEAEGPVPYQPPSPRASSTSSKPLKIVTVRVGRPGRRSTTARMTAKVAVEQRAASSPTSMRSMRGAGAARAGRAGCSLGDASS